MQQALAPAESAADVGLECKFIRVPSALGSWEHGFCLQAQWYFTFLPWNSRLDVNNESTR